MAILDKGGWAEGCRIFHRGKPDEGVLMTMTRVQEHLRCIAIFADLKMIYGTMEDAHFGIFDAGGHLLKSIANVVVGEIAISPSGKRAAISAISAISGISGM